MLPLFLVVLIDLIGFGIILPLLPFYAEHFQATPATVGLLMATYSFTQFLAAPLWGRLSDRFGRRPVLLISLGGAVFSYVWLAFAYQLWVLFAARAVSGLMAGNISAAFAYVADVTAPTERARGMGIVGSAFGLGFIAGPAIGGLLAGPDPANADFQLPALAAAGLSFLALVLALFLLRESLSPEIRARLAAQPPRQRWKQLVQAVRKPKVGRLLLLSFLATFVFAGMEGTFAMWSERRFHWGPEQNGYLFALIGLLSAAIQGGLMGRLAKRFGEARLVVQGALALALGLAVIPFADSLALLLAAMVVATYGFSVTTPSLNSLVSLQVGADEQGGVLGIGRSVTTLARVFGPAWAGYLFSLLGKDWPFLAGTAVMAVVLLLALGLARDPNRS